MDKGSAQGGTESETRGGGAVGGVVSMPQSARSPQIWELLLWGGVSVSPGEGAQQPLGPPQKSHVEQRHTAGRAETVLAGQPGAYSLRGISQKPSIRRTVLGLACINTVRPGMRIKV